MLVKKKKKPIKEKLINLDGVIGGSAIRAASGFKSLGMKPVVFFSCRKGKISSPWRDTLLGGQRTRKRVLKGIVLSAYG